MATEENKPEVRMKLKLLNTALGVVLLAFDVSPVLAASIRLTGATGTSCNYSAIEADSNGNMTVVCSDNKPAPTPASAPRTVPRLPAPQSVPTAQSPLEEIKRWLRAFETINSLPTNLKWEPVHYMLYMQGPPLGRYQMPVTW